GSPLRWLAKIVGLDATSRWIPDRRHGEGRDEVSHGLYQARARCGFGPSTPTGNNIQAASAASSWRPRQANQEQIPPCPCFKGGKGERLLVLLPPRPSYGGAEAKARG